MEQFIDMERSLRIIFHRRVGEYFAIKPFFKSFVVTGIYNKLILERHKTFF